jgi:hypothetical protein
MANEWTISVAQLTIRDPVLGIPIGDARHNTILFRDRGELR